MMFAVLDERPPQHDLLTLLATTDLDALESAMLTQPQTECPVTHHFGPGVYIREVRIPAGLLVVGHSHRDENLNIMLAGKMALLVDGQISIVEAPFMKVALPGRKVGYAIEETVWQNVYATDETDIAKLEEMYVDKSAAWLAHHERAGAIS
jgi:hypothetical protein